MHSLSTLRIWLDAFVIYGENRIRCIRYLHWESSDSMHSLSTVRIWIDAFVIYPFPEVWTVMWCGVLCISFSWCQTPWSFTTNAFLWKSDHCYIFSKLPSFYRLKIKSLPLGGRISPLLLPINHHGWQKKISSLYSGMIRTFTTLIFLDCINFRDT